MKKLILSEKNRVVILFVMVLVTFFFAQADTKKIEKMYFRNDSPVTTSPDQTGNPEAILKTKEIRQIYPLAQLR